MAAKRRSATSALDELFSNGPAEVAAVEPEPSKRRPRRRATTSRKPRAAATAARKPRASGATTVRAEVYLPEGVIQRAKSMLRPERTGARRTLSAALLLQAYVRALDDLALDIDVEGLDRDADEEAVARVCSALERHIEAEVARRAGAQASAAA